MIKAIVKNLGSLALGIVLLVMVGATTDMIEKRLGVYIGLCIMWLFIFLFNVSRTYRTNKWKK